MSNARERTDAGHLTGRMLGRYRIRDVIGRGGMGIVYRGLEEATGREVAVKTMAPNVMGGETAVMRFRREAFWLKRCHAVHIAAVYDAGTADGVDYIAMELMASTLADRISLGPASGLELMTLGAQVLMALAAAHGVGVIHRDVKPANIGITSTGLVKLLDFGVAESLPRSTAADEWSTDGSLREIVGSLPYMPPEQLRGEPLDARSDVYATGVVMYEYATGRTPFDGNHGVDLIDAVLHRRPERPSHFNRVLSRDIDRLILRAIAKKPASRFPSALAMMDSLMRQPVDLAEPMCPGTVASLTSLAH